MRTLLVFTLVVAGLLAALFAVLWLGQRSLLYFPGGPVPPAGQVLPAAREVVLETSDGLELGAWFLEPSGGEATVVIFPGNAGNRAARVPLAQALREHGLGVLLVDYRGYGGNSGRPTEDGLALDARAARRLLVDELGIDPGDLVYFGESLGAGVAAELAVAAPPAALVLRSPFVSVADIAAVHYPFLPARWLLRDHFEVAEHVAGTDVPTVVVLGTGDTIVPPDQSRAVAEAAAGPVHVVEVEGAGHNDRALLDGGALVEAVVTLARQS